MFPYFLLSKDSDLVRFSLIKYNLLSLSPMRETEMLMAKHSNNWPFAKPVCVLLTVCKVTAQMQHQRMTTTNQPLFSKKLRFEPGKGRGYILNK